jgi:hypothetical protein
MDFITEINLEVDKKSWIDNLKHTNSSTAYQLPDWLEIYQKSFNSIPLFITVKNQNFEIAGQLACMIHEEYNWNDVNSFSKLIGMKLKLNSILTWSYGPIIHDTQNQDKILYEILNKLEEILQKYNVTLIRGFTSPNFKFKSTIFEKFDYVLQKWSTYHLNLKNDSETIFSSLNKKIRYDVKQGEKKGFVFEMVNTKSLFDEFSHFAIDAKIQHGEIRKLNRHFFNNLWKLGFGNQFYKVFLAKKDNEILSAVDLLIFNDIAIQVGVINSPNKKYSAGSFLTWNAIKWANENNLSMFDFGGANPFPKTNKEKQIDFYKSKWNNQKLDYFFVTKYVCRNKIRASSVLKKTDRFTNKILKIFSN